MESEPGHASPLEIRVEDVYKSFKTHRVLQGVSLSICRGELVAIVGPSGGGKTVLMHLMIGQFRPDQGRVLVADHESAGGELADLANLNDDGMDRLRIHWAIVFQGNALTSGTVEQNILLPLEWVKGLDDDEAGLRARRAIAAVGLDPDAVLNIDRADLSGGMAKRVAIARAVALEPLLIFYDEPTTGLDPEHATIIRDLVSKTHQEEQHGYPRTTIIITHDKDLLYHLQPRIVMVYDGRVFFDGSYSQFAESDSPIIRPYFELMPSLHQRLVSNASGGGVAEMTDRNLKDETE